MTNPENLPPQLEQNQRQAALALAQLYQGTSRGLARLEQDYQEAQKSGKPRFHGWMVATYQRAILLWDEALSIPKIGASQDLVIDRRPRPKPQEPKPTIPRVDKPIEALPIAKAQASPARPKAEIFNERRKKVITRELSGEVDLDGKEPEVFKTEAFFTSRDEIVVTEKTPGVFGQYFQHPFDRSPKVYTDDKQPRTSPKFKK